MLDATLNIYRAIGEETRLRILILLLRGELTVTELTQILGQSQPRVSRHLKILSDAKLVERYREGAWMFYRVNQQWPVMGDNVPANGPDLAQLYQPLRVLSEGDNSLILRDAQRYEDNRRERAEIAARYFEENAADWRQIRKLHLPEQEIEARMLDLTAPEKVGLFVDIGTGSGRMLELFAERYEQAIGFDLSRQMLSVARANMEAAGVRHAQLRHGDLYALPQDTDTADMICIHHVLHYLDDPAAAVMEASRILKNGGTLLISDFAPHMLESLRDEHAHRRLGFDDEEVRYWCERAALSLTHIETLRPTTKEKQALTVKIWIARNSDGAVD